MGDDIQWSVSSTFGYIVLVQLGPSSQLTRRTELNSNGYGSTQGRWANLKDISCSRSATNKGKPNMYSMVRDGSFSWGYLFLSRPQLEQHQVYGEWKMPGRIFSKGGFHFDFVPFKILCIDVGSCVLCISYVIWVDSWCSSTWTDRNSLPKWIRVLGHLG